MDLSLTLSMVAIVVSVSMTIITLLLTEFRGPNISLLKIPEFQVTDENFSKEHAQEYMPRWFRPKPVQFVFANYGGKAGTILELNLDFTPHMSFGKFFDICQFGLEEPSLPVTIREGDNQSLLFTSPSIRTIDWKRNSLAEVLDSNLKIEDIVAKSLQKSKEQFERFCDFLEKTQEFGKVSCTIILTKGRFRTKVKGEKLFEDVPIEIHYNEAISSLKDCLHRWEILQPTKAQLLDEIERGVRGLIGELRQNLKVLKNPVDEQNTNSYKLRVDNWNNLHRFWDSDKEKIQWFLIESKKGLRKDLTKLYGKIIKCDNLIAELRSYGEVRTQEQFQTVNIEREKLRVEIERMQERLSNLHKRSVS